VRGFIMGFYAAFIADEKSGGLHGQIFQTRR
jgi:hypothetical protein